MDQMMAYGRKLGMVLASVSSLEIALAMGMTRRMRPRSAMQVYQSVAFSLPNFPRQAALDIFPRSQLVTKKEAATLTWKFVSISEVSGFFDRVLQLSGRHCSGMSMGLKTASESVIRVIAFILPTVEISYLPRQGIDTLYVNFLYVLLDEDGEMHPPKDSERREIDISGWEQGVRQQALVDLSAMADAQAPLSPGFLRQLGREKKALETEALMLNEPPTPPSSVGAAKKRPRLEARSRHVFEVEEIVMERASKVLVRWAGYQPSWEAWRIHGEVGTQLETWEPSKNMQDTVAMHAWRAWLLPPTTGL